MVLDHLMSMYGEFIDQMWKQALSIAVCKKANYTYKRFPDVSDVRFQRLDMEAHA